MIYRKCRVRSTKSEFIRILKPESRPIRSDRRGGIIIHIVVIEHLILHVKSPSLLQILVS